MKRHLISALRNPLGYAFNLIGTITQYIPVPRCIDDLITDGCAFFIHKDDTVLNDPFF